MALLLIHAISFTVQPTVFAGMKLPSCGGIKAKSLRSSVSDVKLFPSAVGLRGLTSNRRYRNWNSDLFGNRRLVTVAASRNDSTDEETEAQSTSTEITEPREIGQERAVDDGVIDVRNDWEGRTEGTPEEKVNPGYVMFKRDLERKRKRFWSNFKEQHAIHKSDREQWGVGLNPIFTVYEDAEGNCRRVDVDENEVLSRSGVDPRLTESADEDSIALSKRRLELAKAHARDIELGFVSPSPLSVVYQYDVDVSTVSTGVGSSVGSKSSSYRTLSPWRNLNLIAVSSVFVVLAANWIFSMKRKEKKDPVAQEKDLRLMQIRKLKAQMSRQSTEDIQDNLGSDADVGHATNRTIRDQGEKQHVQEPKEVFGEVVPDGQPRVETKDFQRKVVEIRAMARKARLQEQETAEARSAQSFERKKLLEQELKKERNRVQELENLAKNLDAVRSLEGEDTVGGLDFPPNVVNTVEKIPTVENEEPSRMKYEEPSTSQELGSWSDGLPSNQSGGPDSSLRPSVPPRPKTNSPAGVKPRIILSTEEARAKIAEKRARLNASSSLKPEMRSSKLDTTKGNIDPVKADLPVAEGNVEGTEASAPAQEILVVVPERPLEDIESGPQTGDSHNDNLPQADNSGALGNAKKVVASQDKSTESGTVNLKEQAGQRTQDRVRQESGNKVGEGKKKPDEEEEMEWMRDEVLREIVFKVQANEEAGREPFHNLNSEQEILFFKGLERKFEREGEVVKKWIKDRVENIDYGLDGISLNDPPESFELKWKDGLDKQRKSDLYNRFNEDREKILDELSETDLTSPPDMEETSSSSSSSPSSSPNSSVALPSPVPSTSESRSAKDKPLQDPKEHIPGKSETVISSSPRVGGIVAHQSTGPNAENNKDDGGKESWAHTKRWSKELERMYQMEKDPATKAVMLEIGQDLDRWITEDEIQEAIRLLDKGPEGEEEYAKIHYEKIKAKIKQQRETFGREAMLNKYSEYKSEVEDVELWWLSLPFVVCVGLQRTVDGELQAGLYTVNVSAAMDGVPGKPNDAYHTVAFQDRGDAQNFCTLLGTQAEKVGVDGAELVPLDPKELYEDAKAEGYKVTVIKKGQLKMSVDQPLEEVESQIVDIGSSRYYDEMLRDRTIDALSVIDEGLGYGRPPRSS